MIGTHSPHSRFAPGSAKLVFSNDVAKLVKTLGEKGVGGRTEVISASLRMLLFPDGRTLIADGLDNQRVMIFDRDLKYIGEFGGHGKGPGQFNGVHAVASAPKDASLRLIVRAAASTFSGTTSDPSEVRFRRGVFRIFPAARHHLSTTTAPGSPISVHFGSTLAFKGNRLYTWMVPRELPDGHIEVHTFSVDSKGNLYGGDNQYGRSRSSCPGRTPIRNY